MLAEVEEILEEQTEERELPSFNHSYICAEIIGQINENKMFKALPELTLDIGNGLTSDVSIYLRNQIRPNFLRDFPKYPEMPLVAIEVISASQNIQDLLEKAQVLVTNGVKAVWTIEPFSNSIFVTTAEGEKLFHNQEIESEEIKVDFRKIFTGHSE